ncbi:hypothetical protein TESG_05394 [Trichophyton tonsurans CBS 112818]|uniref:Uncharacterized protein n=2 Tax=Trichophyton TaxID=5550 RepID=F2PIM8_TRIEC|nr:hypothetical protein TESG_05394 [Trichophyton tonsurans CBS 112818]EGE01416.1 hypothetical protein TEQG_00466 [Trichophyton equinum CBS 127.97]
MRELSSCLTDGGACFMSKREEPVLPPAHFIQVFYRPKDLSLRSKTTLAPLDHLSEIQDSNTHGEMESLHILVIQTPMQTGLVAQSKKEYISNASHRKRQEPGFCPRVMETTDCYYRRDLIYSLIAPLLYSNTDTSGISISTGMDGEGSGQMGVFDIETKLVKFPRAYQLGLA